MNLLVERCQSILFRRQVFTIGQHGLPKFRDDARRKVRAINEVFKIFQEVPMSKIAVPEVPFFSKIC